MNRAYGFDEEEGYGFGEDNTEKETSPPPPPRKIVNLNKVPHKKVKVYENNENENENEKEHETSSFQFPKSKKKNLNLTKMKTNPHLHQSRNSRKSPKRHPLVNLTNPELVERLNQEEYGLHYTHHIPNSKSSKGNTPTQPFYTMNGPIKNNPNKNTSKYHPSFFENR